MIEKIRLSEYRGKKRFVSGSPHAILYLPAVELFNSGNYYDCFLSNQYAEPGYVDPTHSRQIGKLNSITP